MLFTAVHGVTKSLWMSNQICLALHYALWNNPDYSKKCKTLQKIFSRQEILHDREKLGQRLKQSQDIEKAVLRPVWRSCG